MIHLVFQTRGSGKFGKVTIWTGQGYITDSFLHEHKHNNNLINLYV